MAGHRPADWHVLDLDKDPTPGDPDRVRSLARTLHDFADDVSDALRLVKGMSDEDTLLQWAGKSAEVFKDEFGGVPKNLKKLKKSYELCGNALADFWPKLERAQALADKALAKAREAQANLSSANSRLASADSWVTRASKEADKYKDDPTGSKSSADKPDESKVRAATRDAQHAKSAQTSAQSDVDNAKDALDAAKKMAADARKMREDAAREAKTKIDEASDAGIQNRSWWEEVGDWFTDNWDNIVTVCKVVVAVVGIVAMIIGGPILGAIVLIAALVVLADTLYKYSKGQASLWDVGLAALDCIPGMKGLTTLGGLAKGLKGGMAAVKGLKGGLKGVGLALRGLGKNARGMVADGAKNAYNRAKNVVRSKGSDPVDMATGAMYLPQIDVDLPGSLPLVFTRRVASDYRCGWWFGPTWSSTVDQRLEVDELGIVFVTEDGLVLTYPHPSVPHTPVLPEVGPRLLLSRLEDGSYRIDDPVARHVRHFARPSADGVAIPTQITDRNQHTITFDYDERGTPLAIRHSGGYHLKLATDEGRITALSLVGAGEDGSDLVIKRYGYTNGNLTETINSSGRPLTFTYDDRLRVTSWTDTNNSKYAYTYDDQDRCIAEGGEAGHITITLDYDGTDPAWPDCRVTTLTTAEGAVSRFVMNGESQVIADIDALGHISRTEYDADHHVLSQTDRLGHMTTIRYDEESRPREVMRADGAVFHFTYGSGSALSEIRRPDGTSWRREYDESGRCTVLTDPVGATTRFRYDAEGNVTEVIDALGNARTVQCNPAGLPVMTTDPLGATTTWKHDAFGRITAYIDPQGRTTRLFWTVEGRLARRVTSDGAIESWTYDGEGNCTSHTTPTGAVTRFEYTHFDLPSARTGPDGARYEFIHDPSLRLVQVINPQGLTWTYEHDAAGRLTSETDFDDRAIAYSYDAAGRLTSRTDLLGQTMRYEYDSIGNLIRKRSESQVTEFTYDLNRQLVGAISPESSLSLLRDTSGLVTRETVNGRHLSYEYDLLGRVTQRTTPSGASSRWTYDAVGNRSQLEASGRIVRFDHDWSGLETARHIGEGVSLQQKYDGLGRLTAQELSTRDDDILQRAYTYAEDGNLIGIDDMRSGSRRFTLDAGNRVTSVHASNWTERYAYDEAGNLTDASWPTKHPGSDAAGSRAYVGTRVTRAGDTRYEYDVLGRVIMRQKKRLSRKPDTWRYTWDSENRLTSVVTPDGNRWRYVYDPLGRRTAKQRLAADGLTITEQVDFTWDGVILCEETTRVASVPQQMTLTWEHDGLHPITQTERIAAADAPQEEIDSRFFAIVTDLIGTPTELVDEAGGVAWYTRSTLWGSTTWNADASAYTPLRFPGQYYDPETGLHHNYFRHYDPETARYMSPDPLGLAPAPNPVAYVPNPHTGVDLLGLSPYYSEIAPNGQRGPAYAVVTPQVLDDAAANLIGSPPGRGARYAPPGFQGGAAGHSRGHLIGQQFGGDGRDMRNIVTQGSTQNNGPISDAEDLIAKHVRDTGNTVTMSVTPEYANGGNVPSHVLIEAVDDFGWSYSNRLPNM
ncbi:RHS repeat-associated core domain-containing protein [Streptomyces sp. NPDC051001]|uniref:RHS repeat-associated core domain-containing protein n=1 Tax=Streptomyces sp. NPDC051001 TaxID=3155795 RepID=UPI0034407761